MAKALTAAAVEKVKSGSARREIPDGLLTGLYLIVQKSGRKSWAVRYRAAGKPRKLTLGAYPALGLTEARDEAKAALRRVQQGQDPAAEKKSEADRKYSNFENVARSFLSRHAKPNNRSWKESARLLGLIPDKAQAPRSDDPHTFVIVKGSPAAKWGHRDIVSISRGEVIAALDKIVDRGAPAVANRTLAALRKMFNWAVERDLLEDNPCAGIKAPAAEQSRDRVLTDDELRAFWTACGELGAPFGPLFRLLLLTGQRREEAAALTWNEIEGNTWTIPRERAKNDKAHAVPLSNAAEGVLDGVVRVAGEKGYAFTTTGETPVSGFSRAKAKLDERMLAVLQKEAAKGGGDPEKVVLQPWRLHDLRRTVASGMARLGINLPVIERVLNHVSGSFGGIVGVYQRHEFQDEKQAALEAWGRFVMSLAEPSENVIEMRRRKKK